jgi:hypothetical protein
MSEKRLVIQEKKVIEGNKIIILTKRTNIFVWYSLLALVIIVSVIEFFRIWTINSAKSFIVEFLIISFIVLVSFMIFTYKKIKMKIIRNRNGDIFIERLETITIKDNIIKSPKNPYFIFEEHENNHWLKIAYKNNKNKEISLELLPFFDGLRFDPVYLDKKTIEEIGKFLDMKIVLKQRNNQ